MDLLCEVYNKATIHDFVKFVARELQLQRLPKKISLTNKSLGQTFGTYAPDLDELVIYAGNRHTVDILRTLAHELVHHKQMETGVSLDGSDGSPIENEANSIAGELLRKYRYKNPEIYTEK